MADTERDTELYQADSQRRADRALKADADRKRQDAGCMRCKAIDNAVPTEVQLRSLLVDDLDIERECFIPRAQTAEQAAAGAAFAYGLALFIKAYGLELAGARMTSALDVLRLFAKSARIEARQAAAREALARARHDAGEVGPAEAAEFVRRGFTPDYPGKDRDDAWLAENIHA